jgi:hypothetical protein
MQFSSAEYQTVAFIGKALLDRLSAVEIRRWNRSSHTLSDIAARLGGGEAQSQSLARHP